MYAELSLSIYVFLSFATWILSILTRMGRHVDIVGVLMTYRYDGVPEWPDIAAPLNQVADISFFYCIVYIFFEVIIVICSAIAYDSRYWRLRHTIDDISYDRHHRKLVVCTLVSTLCLIPHIVCGPLLLKAYSVLSEYDYLYNFTKGPYHQPMGISYVLRTVRPMGILSILAFIAMLPGLCTMWWTVLCWHEIQGANPGAENEEVGYAAPAQGGGAEQNAWEMGGTTYRPGMDDGDKLPGYSAEAPELPRKN